MMISNINNLNNIVDDIVNRIDAALANELLKKISALSPQERIELGSELNEIITKLKIVDFPEISDSDAADLISSNLLTFFKIEVPFEQRLIARYSFQGITEKNEQREIIKESILQNHELLGNLTIGEWLKKFDNQYETEDRNDEDIFNFFAKKETANLKQSEKIILKSIIHTYDTLIASELIDIFDAVAILRSFQRKYGSVETIELPDLSASSLAKSPLAGRSDLRPTVPHNISPVSEEGRHLKKLFFNTAIKTYSDLGEQLITSNYIRLKSFPQPVRPSIKNWISDYTFNLGFGEHNSMQRGDYLFRNENARVLGTQDKERLSYILKAVDDNLEVTINLATKQVIFPSAHTSEPRNANPQQRSFGNNQARQNTAFNINQDARNRTTPSQPHPSSQNYPQTGRMEPGNWNAERRTADTEQKISSVPRSFNDQNQMPTSRIKFSSPQTLPIEKTRLPQSSPRPAFIAPQKPPEPAQPQPIRIHPISRLSKENDTEKNRDIPKNVVNLKEQ